MKLNWFFYNFIIRIIIPLLILIWWIIIFFIIILDRIFLFIISYGLYHFIILMFLFSHLSFLFHLIVFLFLVYLFLFILLKFSLFLILKKAKLLKFHLLISILYIFLWNCFNFSLANYLLMYFFIIIALNIHIFTIRSYFITLNHRTSFKCWLFLNFELYFVEKRSLLLFGLFLDFSYSH